jgi:hypothetical protein
MAAMKSPSPDGFSRVACASLVLMLCIGLWQSYGAWLVSRLTAHVA